MATRKPRFPARTAGGAVAAGAVGWMWEQLPWPDGTAADHVGWWLIGGGAVVFGGAVWRFSQRRSGSAGALSRWSRHSEKHDGLASTFDLWWVASSWAMHRRAAVLRPSLAAVSWWRRWRTPATEFATKVARVGLLGVWSPVEDVTLRLGGPRTGKTGELACRIIDAPGAVVATSTRTDLVSLTSASRAYRGPVHVFNPSGLGGLATTVKFSPLIGCRSPRVAADRAADLVAASTGSAGGGDREWWAGQARDVLALLLHAAALVDETMHTVAHWVAKPSEAQSQVLRALDRSPQAVAMREVALGFFQTNDRTQTSITTSIRPALAWLTDETAAAAAQDGSAAAFDIEEFLKVSGTLYLLGAEDAVVAPLVASLTAEIARTARRLAADQGGRLDPPLTMALDEAALICPVPLDRWTADMGGRNITIHVGAQSRAQLRQRWGVDGAAAILNNSATILVFGGMRDPDDLAAFSALSGEREDITYNRNENGEVTGSTTKRVPVLSPAQLANLPAKRVMVIRRSLPVSIGRVQMAWERRAVRRAKRRAPNPIAPTTYRDEAHAEQARQAADQPPAAPAGATTAVRS